ncbi:uncharacterized protein LOC117123866 [Anneissia japonica]|uniref:uncharacterized protein LOC117123866 n=1 Tax=Anneissia japonica TaxID=1529436 RepID=UPI0014257FC9|nr:uncharacterized protein LOC117123866 [Anneissia japonica]
MDAKVVYIISIAVTSVGILASADYGDDTSNERLHRQRRQTGAGGAYSSSGTFAWWKIVLVVGGGLAGMEILYCCCKNYLRKQGADSDEKNKVQKGNDNRSESSKNTNQQTANHIRKNNSFVEAMAPQGYSTLRENMSPSHEYYYSSIPTLASKQTSYTQQQNTFYVDQPPPGNFQYTHHMISETDSPTTHWGRKMHPLLGASTFV